MLSVTWHLEQDGLNSLADVMETVQQGFGLGTTLCNFYNIYTQIWGDALHLPWCHLELLLFSFEVLFQRIYDC